MEGAGIPTAIPKILDNGRSPDQAGKPMDVSYVAVIHPFIQKIPDNARILTATPKVLETGRSRDQAGKPMDVDSSFSDK